MKYQVGRLGRAFIIQLEHGDDVMAELVRLAEQEDINTAVLMLIGALRSGGMVLGPEECLVPPRGIEQFFDDGRELIAIGTILRNEEGNPSLHIHGSAGRSGSVLTGCLRRDLQAYLLVEAVMLELDEISVRRIADPNLQVKVLDWES
jgi:hypothetical protein